MFKIRGGGTNFIPTNYDINHSFGQSYNVSESVSVTQNPKYVLVYVERDDDPASCILLFLDAENHKLLRGLKSVGSAPLTLSEQSETDYFTISSSSVTLLGKASQDVGSSIHGNIIIYY